MEKENEVKRIQYRVTEEVYNKITEIAEINGLNQASLTRLAVFQFLNRYESGEESLILTKKNLDK